MILNNASRETLVSNVHENVNHKVGENERSAKPKLEVLFYWCSSCVPQNKWSTRKVTAQKMKFSIQDFFSKCDQIHRKLRIWPHLLKKSLIENFIVCAVSVLKISENSQAWVWIWNPFESSCWATFHRKNSLFLT